MTSAEKAAIDADIRRFFSLRPSRGVSFVEHKEALTINICSAALEVEQVCGKRPTVLMCDPYSMAIIDCISTFVLENAGPSTEPWQVGKIMNRNLDIVAELGRIQDENYKGPLVYEVWCDAQGPKYEILFRFRADGPNVAVLSLKEMD